MSWPRPVVLSANDISDGFFGGGEMSVTQDSKTTSPRYRAGSQSLKLRRLRVVATYALFLTPFLSGCDEPHTYVVLDNNYPSSTTALVVYHAFWQAVSFQIPVPPGSSSDLQSTIPASANTAYVVLAPGWDPTSSRAPTSLIAMQSRNGFEVHLNHILHIPVDDATFVGNCAARSFLSQDQADFITQRVFPSDFTALRYDAANCTTAPLGDTAGH
jgi:hypothetical protein